MAEAGWSQEDSPFHTGEMAAQERFGVRERVERQGRRVIRDYMTEQHRQFYSQLPFLVAGSVDTEGWPWASLLVGEPGFLSTPDERTLRVSATPLPGDPLAANLQEGTALGLLGIELHTRRRNRLNGTVVALEPQGFEVQVAQSFGNCPQYIQVRHYEPAAQPSAVRLHPFSDLSTAERALIGTADTFFIATAYLDEGARAARGVDVSHRGGRPGFVRIDDERTLTIPDFSGNLHFSTVGNLMLYPRAGLLFVDFDRGELLYMSGEAVVLWEDEQVRTFAGAERLLRFHLNKGVRVEGSLPLRWSV